MNSRVRTQGFVTLAAVIAGGLISLTGCGNEFGATVSGVVTLDGEPVSPGLVTFAPKDAGVVPAVSDLSSSGGYSLSTNKKTGVAPGVYQVSVQAFKPPDVPPGQRSFKPSEPLVPEKYMQVATSGLEYEVTRGTNRIDIALTSQ